MLKVSAPGKIILSGEHAVVYGYPAILSAVNKRLSVSFGKASYKKQGLIYKAIELLIEKLEIKNFNKNLKAISEIPVGSGMGSSAALSVALSGFFYKNYKNIWDLNLINKMAYQIEKIQHGNPSGGDNTVSCYGGLLFFRKGKDEPVFENLKQSRKFPDIMVIQSGRPKETTGEMVGFVRDLFLKRRNKVRRIFNNIELVTKGFGKCLSGNSCDFSLLIEENEKLLEELGVVSEEAWLLIEKLRKIGGVAKISGAGGIKKGSGIIIAYHKEPEKLIAFAKSNKLDTISVKLGAEGVRIEKN